MTVIRADRVRAVLAAPRGFLDNTRSEALDHVVTDSAERASLEKLATVVAVSSTTSSGPEVRPQGPGRPYTLAEATAVAQGKLTARDFHRGKGLFTALACSACHRFQGEGGAVGPDLSAAGNRFSLHDLLESIVEPAKVVSDQYQNVMPPGLINSLNENELRDLLAYVLSGGNPDDAAHLGR
jgi:mono/diheme cytochrome c family protein